MFVKRFVQVVDPSLRCCPRQHNDSTAIQQKLFRQSVVPEAGAVMCSNDSNVYLKKCSQRCDERLKTFYFKMELSL